MFAIIDLRSDPRFKAYLAGIQILGPYLEDTTPIDIAGRIAELTRCSRATAAQDGLIHRNRLSYGVKEIAKMEIQAEYTSCLFSNPSDHLSQL